MNRSELHEKLGLKDDSLLRSVLGSIGIFVILFIPSISISTGHNIDQELVYYLPWMILIFIRPAPFYESFHLRVLPLPITLIVFIPTLYTLWYLWLLIGGKQDRIGLSLKIIGFSVLQIILILVSFLSIEVYEERQFYPYPFYIVILMFLVVTGMWYYEEAKARLNYSEDKGEESGEEGHEQSVKK